MTDRRSLCPSKLRGPKTLGNGPNPWQPETDQLRLAVLGKLAEEASECATAAARCMIQGIDECEPVTGKSNREWLEDEIADVIAQTRRASEALGLDIGRIMDRAKAKEAFTKQWQGDPTWQTN